ncbi:hypothetical protein [Rhizobium tumorigenes]|uniref:hypothetical protein n=1 Tax=Rhizobium tumorigenes TaxID=2041385 RepID=UPI0024200C9E|nr:hypothetical protein [Rhizobium tumorigenes]WFS01626.1 hypothetical protein PR016_03035 [Rhizobium tumorigenes]
MSEDIYGDDDPIPLAKACQIFFRGALTKSSLRTEHRKGNLEIIQIANKDFVTRNAIKRMQEKCRKNGGQPGFGSGPTAERGSSKTEIGVSAQSALRMKLQQRKQSLQNTSPASTSRSAEVVPLR